jgi:cytochrome P450
MLARVRHKEGSWYIMSIEQSETTPAAVEEPVVGCPIDHSAWSAQKTTRGVERTDIPVDRDASGVWHVHTFEEARAVLRSGNVMQAGFGKETMDGLDRENKMKPPVLFQEGKDHQLQRKQTAKYFTPKAVDSNYRQLMDTVSGKLISDFRRKKHADLSSLSRFMAVKVAAEVIGLTNSILPGMGKRLDMFFEGDVLAMAKHMTPKVFLKSLGNQYAVTAFFFLDVKPAIRARKRAQKDDVISHLVAQGCTDAEILAECITYAAAGMATTREFICVAAWHMLEDTQLRTRYLAAPENERYDILNELLRLEPIVGNLYRRTTAEIQLNGGDQPTIIPQGALVDVHVRGANIDERVAGEKPLSICPGRPLTGSQIPQALMSFGDGIHRCPGSYIAIQESDMFLQRLLSIEGLSIQKQPTVTWHELITGYEIRDFQLAVN